MNLGTHYSPITNISLPKSSSRFHAHRTSSSATRSHDYQYLKKKSEEGQCLSRCRELERKFFELCSEFKMMKGRNEELIIEVNAQKDMFEISEYKILTLQENLKENLYEQNRFKARLQDTKSQVMEMEQSLNNLLARIEDPRRSSQH